MRTVLLSLGLALGMGATAASAVDRFPRPDFDGGHVPPRLLTPPPRITAMEWVDVAALAAALSAAAAAALKTRSRRQMLLLSVACLAYFGFARRGCVCPVGSLQNVTLALADPGYALPFGVAVFFLLPLVFALLFGRVFCAAVCPLGAAQDLVMVRPVRLPAWLLPALRPIPWLYLGAAVLLAATGAGFVVCRFDPFVGFFRLGATFPMLVTGALFLLAGMFIARPYCRFFCPYGAILGACSFISRRHVTITPDECVHCRLCEDSCPFGAIRPPTPDRPPEARRAGVARLAAVLLALPVLALAGAAAGARLGPALARLHPAVRLAGLLRMEDRGAPAGSTLETQTFRETKTPPEKVHAESRRVGERSAAAGGWLGAFTGLVFGANILALSLRRTRKDYTPDPVSCLSCARCFRRCPREWLRLKAAGKDREGRRGDRTV